MTANAPDPSSVEGAFVAVYGPAAGRHGVPAAADGKRPDTADPVLGVDAYRGEDLWHLVTVGLAGVRPGEDGTGAPLGHELTVLTPAAERPPAWAFALLLGTARTSLAVGRPFHAGARLAPGPPLDGGESGIVALGLREDPVVHVDSGPLLLQAVGVTTGEYLLMQRVGTTTVLDRLAQRDPLLRTDPARA
ncbi:MAG: suppressor of fused domain protein [Patulibacter sp.]